MVDCYTNESYPLYPCPCVIPSDTDSGLGHVTCFGQWDISKGVKLRFDKSLCIGHCPLGMLP